MTDTQIVKVDQGAINARILAKEVKTDFRRVEAASLKMTTHFKSAEGKRLFVRYFHSLQLLAHFISVIARTKLKPEDIERVEAAIRKNLEAVDGELNKVIDGAEALFKSNGITSFATYDTKPLELEVGIISSSGRRFMEILNKFDDAMPLLQTLEIHDVITMQNADIQRFGMKRAIREFIRSTRNLASGVRRRMNEQSAKEVERDRAVRKDAGMVASSKSGDHLASGVDSLGASGDDRPEDIAVLDAPNNIPAADGVSVLSVVSGSKLPQAVVD